MVFVSLWPSWNKSGTNPQGSVNVLIKSHNQPDGSLDPNNIYTYSVTSNAISELTLRVDPTTGTPTASFGGKVTVKWEKADGTVQTIDSGNMLQMTLNDYNKPDMVAITVQKSSAIGGGLWYSSGWGPGSNGVPTTIQKPIVGNVTINQ